MSIIWQPAPAPFIDPNGDPYAGAKAYFFDANTTTPRIVYRDGGMNVAHDHPVVANSAGVFPAVFLPEGDYRLRITDATGVTFWDVDGITTPGTGSGGGGGGGITLPTGKLDMFYGIGPVEGWVRCNGNTIGAAASGATGRASADCEALFNLLWTSDPTLPVGGGRGASAAGDWAANKVIQTPDFRGRVLAGLNGMGAGSIPGFIDNGQVDNGETANTLGATMGASSIRLAIADLPSHDHGGSTLGAGGHNHQYQRRPSGVQRLQAGPNEIGIPTNELEGQATNTVGDHAHPIQSQGGNQFHLNMQPTAFVSIHIKL